MTLAFLAPQSKDIFEDVFFMTLEVPCDED